MSLIIWIILFFQLKVIFFLNYVNECIDSFRSEIEGVLFYDFKINDVCFKDMYINMFSKYSLERL